MDVDAPGVSAGDSVASSMDVESSGGGGSGADGGRASKAKDATAGPAGPRIRLVHRPPRREPSEDGAVGEGGDAFPPGDLRVRGGGDDADGAPPAAREGSGSAAPSSESEAALEKESECGSPEGVGSTTPAVGEGGDGGGPEKEADPEAWKREPYWEQWAKPTVDDFDHAWFVSEPTEEVPQIPEDWLDHCLEEVDRSKVECIERDGQLVTEFEAALLDCFALDKDDTEKSSRGRRREWSFTCEPSDVSEAPDEALKRDAFVRPTRGATGGDAPLLRRDSRIHFWSFRWTTPFESSSHTSSRPLERDL